MQALKLYSSRGVKGQRPHSYNSHYTQRRGRVISVPQHVHTIITYSSSRCVSADSTQRETWSHSSVWSDMNWVWATAETINMMRYSATALKGMLDSVVGTGQRTEKAEERIESKRTVTNYWILPSQCANSWPLFIIKQSKQNILYRSTFPLFWYSALWLLRVHFQNYWLERSHLFVYVYIFMHIFTECSSRRNPLVKET